jgi:hypothetical protein
MSTIGVNRSASVRASGYSIGYTFGLILPGLYTFYGIRWLSQSSQSFGCVSAPDCHCPPRCCRG